MTLTDLWNLHSSPTSIRGYRYRLISSPGLAVGLANGGKLSMQDIKIAENTIARSGIYSYKYAFSALKPKRFPAGEGAISRSGRYSYLYARDVINGRFERGEKAIGKYPKFAFLYTIEVVKGRFLAGERTISKSPHFSNEYASYLFNDLVTKNEITKSWNGWYIID